MDADSWRFADETAKKMTKTVGAYGCDLVPSTAIKSSTGVQRGEELFHRPELYRPWRGEAQQRNAEALVGKEQEIEILTRKNSELRSETAALQRELQRALTRAKLAEQGQSEVYDRDTRKLQDTITDLRSQLELQKSSADHQLRVVRSEHETELKQMQAKVKLAQDAANDSGNLYAKQLTEVKAAASREVALIQQLSNARAAELQNELDASRDALRRLQERTSELLADAQSETRRVEERCTAQLREQELRLDKVRSSLHAEIQSLEVKAELYRSQFVESSEKSKSTAFELQESEARFKDWNVRLLSDLDQLYEYYYAVVRDIQGGEERVALVRQGETEASPGSLKGVMERVADRLQQLATLKQQHAQASDGLQKKVRQLESTSASSADLFRKTSEEKDVQLSRLYGEVSEAKSRQQRLEKAFSEMQEQVGEAGRALHGAAHRLQFYADDLNTSLSHMGVNPMPPRENVAFVACHVDGAAVLWETCAPAMQAAMTICNDVLRGKLRQHGGYEFACEGGCLMIAFQDSMSACRFALESQEWLCRARWPPELLEHSAARDEKSSSGHVLFRGLRVGMTLHYGEVETEESNVPVGIGTGRVNYFGKTITQLLHIGSFCSGGQIVLSSQVRHAIKDTLGSLDSPVISELGQHRLSLASRGSKGNEQAFSSTEMVTLFQLLPRSLLGRTFARETTMDSSVSAGGIGIASHFSGINRAAIGAQVTALRSRQMALSRGAETLSEEMESVSAAVTSLSCKIRDAQVHGRIYSQADIVAHVAAIDRIVARTDVVRRDVERVGVAYRENMAAIKGLEEQVNLQTKVSITDDEYKKKLDLINDRAAERLFEAKLQSEHQIQQLRNSLLKAESTAADLRKQLVSGNKNGGDTNGTIQTAAGPAADASVHLSKVSVIEPKAKSGPRQGAAIRAHSAIADAKKHGPEKPRPKSATKTR